MKEKMKIAITGHTSGLGLSIYNHFNQKPEFAVRGISRATGFDLTTDADEVIQLIKSNNFDYFFNNAYVDGVQSKLLRELSEHTCVISSGSMAADAAQVKHEPYYVNKFDLECTHRSIKRNNKLPMLLLKMGYLENYVGREPISYATIVSAIDFWIQNPRASMIEFDNINYAKNFPEINKYIEQKND
jgi:hypothetical protein